MLIEPGKALDRYTIEALVGQGGMGDVYRAFDTRLRRHVALKVLHTGDDRESRAATLSALGEARAAAAIAHPNATATFDADEVGGTPFIVMEFVRGTSLRQFIGDESVPMGVRIRWLVDIAEALAAAHEVGIVHRDVKPENVMVRDDGIVKVLDFGVARRTGLVGTTNFDDAYDSAPPLEARIVGTPVYMAPELIRADEVDGRADQFGWGVLCYELLAGRIPWKTATNFLTSLTAVMTEAVVPLSEVVASIPVEVDAAILRALAKAPEDRFPSMGAAASELVPHMRRNATAHRPSVPPASARRPRRSPLPSFGSDATVVASAPATPVAPTQVSPLSAIPSAVRAPEEPPASPRSPQPSRRFGGPSAPPSWPSSIRPRPASNPTELRPQFRDPNFELPVDVDAHVRLVPEGATCKGMFFADLLQRGAPVGAAADMLAAAGIAERRFLGFRDYPLVDLVRLTATIASALQPDVPTGEALRSIGQATFGAVLASHVGRSVLGALGDDVEAILLAAPKVLRLFVNVGEFTAERLDFRTFHIRAQRFPAFLETFQVGVLEAALAHCKRNARVRVALDDLSSGVVEVRLT